MVGKTGQFVSVPMPPPPHAEQAGAEPRLAPSGTPCSSQTVDQSAGQLYDADYSYAAQQTE